MYSAECWSNWQTAPRVLVHVQEVRCDVVGTCLEVANSSLRILILPLSIDNDTIIFSKA
jgi:hypothetical protein